MSTARRAASVVALLTLGTITFAAASMASTDLPSRPPKTPAEQVQHMEIAIPWQGGHQRFIDVGRHGLGPGDLFLATGQPILDNATGERIGSGDAVELIVSARHNGTVTSQSTLRLPGGHVDIDGIIRHTDNPLRMTVTGGTGKYVGADGQLVLVKEDARRKVSVMRLELAR